jgi:uracil-DNA glycosylase
MDVKIEEGWKNVLKGEFSKPYFQNAVTFIKVEKSQGKTIYPRGPLFLMLSIKHHLTT